MLESPWRDPWVGTALSFRLPCLQPARTLFPTDLSSFLPPTMLSSYCPHDIVVVGLPTRCGRREAGQQSRGLRIYLPHDVVAPHDVVPQTMFRPYICFPIRCVVGPHDLVASSPQTMLRPPRVRPDNVDSLKIGIVKGLSPTMLSPRDVLDTYSFCQAPSPRHVEPLFVGLDKVCLCWLGATRARR